MTIIEGIRTWLKTYDGFAGERINVDFLTDDVKTYSVDSVPTKEVIKKYLDGSTLRQFLFCVSSREFYGEDIQQRRHPRFLRRTVRMARKAMQKAVIPHNRRWPHR